MAQSKRDLNDSERALWRAVARTVRTNRPLPEAPRGLAAEPAKPKAKPTEPVVRRRAPAAPGPLADRAGERRVKRGDLVIDATIDLHGHTQDRALTALTRFLHHAQSEHARVVLVITGKGRAREAVLKARLPDWLESAALRPLIAGYAEAHARHGGAGAAYVFLKRK